MGVKYIIPFDFAEGNGSHPGSFEPKGKAADSAEKVEDIKVHNPLISLWESSI